MQKNTLKPWISQSFGVTQGPCRSSVSRLGAFSASVDEKNPDELLWALQRGDEALAMELLKSAQLSMGSHVLSGDFPATFE